jgi:hypothetical protein
MADKQTHLYWLEAIQSEASDSLTEWEIGFIESIAQWLTHSELTTRQADMLEKIYVKYTK